jgi:predicted transcriptional regulator
MRALWETGGATVAQVQAALESERPLAYSTLATVLSRMEQKQLVRHDADGRTFVFRALVTERDVSRSLVRGLVEELFDGSPAQLVSHLLQQHEVDRRELERIKQMLVEHEATRGRRRKGRSGVGYK